MQSSREYGAELGDHAGGGVLVDEYFAAVGVVAGTGVLAEVV